MRAFKANTIVNLGYQNRGKKIYASKYRLDLVLAHNSPV